MWKYLVAPLLNSEHGLNKGVIWVEPTDHPDIDTSRYFGEQEGKKEVMCDIIMWTTQTRILFVATVVISTKKQQQNS